VPYLSAFAVVIHYEEVLYQVYVPLPLHDLDFSLVHCIYLETDMMPVV